jgi:hypothetical protein
VTAALVLTLRTSSFWIERHFSNVKLLWYNFVRKVQYSYNRSLTLLTLLLRTDDLNIKQTTPSRRQNRDVDISGFMDMQQPISGSGSIRNFGNQEYLENVMRVAK